VEDAKSNFSIFSLFTTFNSVSQTASDSLIIDCCNYDLIGNHAIPLAVSNTNVSEIFDYPGFILVADNGDTSARETVNYFGIGWGSQTHYL